MNQPTDRQGAGSAGFPRIVVPAHLRGTPRTFSHEQKDSSLSPLHLACVCVRAAGALLLVRKMRVYRSPVVRMGIGQCGCDCD